MGSARVRPVPLLLCVFGRSGATAAAAAAIELIQMFVAFVRRGHDDIHPSTVLCENKWR